MERCERERIVELNETEIEHGHKYYSAAKKHSHEGHAYSHKAARLRHFVLEQPPADVHEER
jgi:hypothetical protein